MAGLVVGIVLVGLLIIAFYGLFAAFVAVLSLWAGRLVKLAVKNHGSFGPSSLALAVAGAGVLCELFLFGAFTGWWWLFAVGTGSAIATFLLGFNLVELDLSGRGFSAGYCRWLHKVVSGGTPPPANVLPLKKETSESSSFDFALLWSSFLASMRGVLFQTPLAPTRKDAEAPADAAPTEPTKTE